MLTFVIVASGHKTFSKKAMLLFLLSFLHIALLIDTAMANSIDTLYIKSYEKKFSVKTIFADRKLSFTLNRTKTDDTLFSNRIRYRPNSSLLTGIGATYGNFQVSMLLRIPKSTNNEKRFGKTSYRDVKVNFSPRRFLGSFFYRRYKGFYQSNQLISNKKHIPEFVYPQRGDIEFAELGAETVYIFNHNRYSIHASLKQTEKQIRNVGSVLLKSNLKKVAISSDSSMIPPEVEQFYTDLIGISKADFYAFSISAGYTYCFTFGQDKQFFLNPLVFIGPGYQFNKYRVRRGFLDKDFLNVESNVKLFTGYNGKLFSAGLVLDVENRAMSRKRVQLNPSINFLRLNVGVKF